MDRALAPRFWLDLANESWVEWLAKAGLNEILLEDFVGLKLVLCDRDEDFIRQS